MTVKIKVFSDYVCPYCFLAELPLATAIQDKDVEVEWLPFELRPTPQSTLKPEKVQKYLAQQSDIDISRINPLLLLEKIKSLILFTLIR